MILGLNFRMSLLIKNKAQQSSNPNNFIHKLSSNQISEKLLKNVRKRLAFISSCIKLIINI